MIRIFQPSSATASPSSLPSPGATETIRWHWTTLSGPDSLDFLHRVTTVNTRGGIQVGEGSSGCFLTAQGKLRTYFKLWNTAENEFAFEYDGGAQDHWKEALFTAIDQFTFAEKMTLTDVTELECRWLFLDVPENHGGEDRLKALLELPSSGSMTEGRTFLDANGIRLCHQGSWDFGRIWLTVWGKPAQLSAWIGQRKALSAAASVTTSELNRWRIESMGPWIGHELKEDTIPLEAGLSRAIAQNKGCYPGQEVIEKIVSLGAPPRRLVLIEGTGPTPSPGSRLMTAAVPAQEAGTLTSVQALDESSGGRYKALAYVRKSHAQEGLTIQIEGSASPASIVRIAPYV